MNPYVAVLIASLSGSLPSAYLAGRFFGGVDLRRQGSGNLGATNVFRVLGLPAAFVVFLLDAAKGALPVLLLPAHGPNSARGSMPSVAVVGAGAWGTALADLLARNGHPVRLWAREPDVAESVTVRHENMRFLAGVALSSALAASTALADVVRGADLVMFATPSEHLRAVATLSLPAISPGATLAVATKGIEPGSLEVMTQVVRGATNGG